MRTQYILKAVPYAFALLWLLFISPKRGEAQIRKNIKYSELEGLPIVLSERDALGEALANLGDLDGDSINELAVGLPGENASRGAVLILFFDENNSIRVNPPKISSALSEISLEANDFFGSAIAGVGDINGDGIPDMVVGANGDDSGGRDRGALWLFFLNRDGTFNQVQKISSVSGFPHETPENDDLFGVSVAGLPDLDGDGVPEIAAGASGDDGGGRDRGAVWILFMNRDGQVKRTQKISSNTGSVFDDLGDRDRFGHSLSAIADDAQNRLRLAVGAPRDNNGIGALWMLQVPYDLSTIALTKITSDLAVFDGALTDDEFGFSVSFIGDLDNDGIDDVAVGAPFNDDSSGDSGAANGSLWVLYLRDDGSPRDGFKISNSSGSFTGGLNNSDFFGSAVTSLGDMDSDGIIDIIVGAPGDDDGGASKGAFWVLFQDAPPVLNTVGTLPSLSQFERPINVLAAVSDPSGIQEVEINFREGGDVLFFTAAMTQEQGENWSYLINSGLATENGVEYYITAVDESNLSARFPSEGVFSAQVNVPSGIQASSVLRNNEYRLISIPLVLDDPSPSAVFEDDLGTYRESRWRLFEPSPSSDVSSYAEFQDINAIIPGKGYWLISNSGRELIDSGAGRTVPTEPAFEIQLNRGWNAIGNPFAFPIPVENVYMLDAMGKRVNPALYTYSREGWQTGVSQIVPFEGYALPNNTSEVQTLFIDPDFSDVQDAPVLSTGILPELDWQIRIRTITSTYSDESLAAVSSFAQDGWDFYDLPNPPAPGEFVSTEFYHPEWQKPLKRYKTDLRSIGKPGYTWNLEVSSSGYKQARLRFEELSTVPDEFEILLLDEVKEQVFDVRAFDEYVLDNLDPSYRYNLKLVIGKPEFIESLHISKPLASPEASLFVPYPNPFSKTTTFSFLLTTGSYVTLSVFNALGQEVERLYDNTWIEAGHHRIQWDTVQKNLASGMYHVRIHSSGLTQVKSFVYINRY